MLKKNNKKTPNMLDQSAIVGKTQPSKPASAAKQAAPVPIKTPATAPAAPAAPRKAAVKPTAAPTVSKAPAPTPAPTAPPVVVPAPASDTIKVGFSLDVLDASQVFVSGCFNAWKPDATPMSRNGARWEATISLRPGRYQYKFVVDGQWMHDPRAGENVYNEHGTLNSVIQVA